MSSRLYVVNTVPENGVLRHCRMTEYQLVNHLRVVATLIETGAFCLPDGLAALEIIACESARNHDGRVEWEYVAK